MVGITGGNFLKERDIQPWTLESLLCRRSEVYKLRLNIFEDDYSNEKAAQIGELLMQAVAEMPFRLSLGEKDILLPIFTDFKWYTDVTAEDERFHGKAQFTIWLPNIFFASREAILADIEKSLIDLNARRDSAILEFKEFEAEGSDEKSNLFDSQDERKKILNQKVTSYNTRIECYEQAQAFISAFSEDDFKKMQKEYIEQCANWIKKIEQLFNEKNIRSGKVDDADVVCSQFFSMRQFSDANDPSKDYVEAKSNPDSIELLKGQLKESDFFKYLLGRIGFSSSPALKR